MIKQMTRVIYNNVGQFLDPQDTNIRIQAFLCDTKFLQEPNPYGEYKFSFQPCTMEDEHRLFEHIEKAKMTVELGLGAYADLMPSTDVELPNGLPYCNQLFASKLNTEVPFEEWLGNKEASLNLYLRNDPKGKIYLQCSYVDVMEPFYGWKEQDEKRQAEMELAFATSDPSDWDW